MKSCDTSSRSCSCTSCFYKSNTAQLKNMLWQDSRRGNVNLDKYTPLLGQQLVGMSVKTRAVVNEVEYQFISQNNVSDDSITKLPAVPKHKGDDLQRPENRSDVYFNKGGTKEPLLSGCCSCCSCGCSKRQHVCRCCSCTCNKRRQIHTSDQQDEALCMNYGGLGSDIHKDRLISTHTKCKVNIPENCVHHKTKHIQSDPCSYVLESMGLQKPVPEGSVRRPKQQQQDDCKKIETKSQKIRQVYQGMATGMEDYILSSATKVMEIRRNTKNSRDCIENERKYLDKMKEQEKNIFQKTRPKHNYDIMRMAEQSNYYANYYQTSNQQEINMEKLRSNGCFFDFDESASTMSNESLEIKTQGERKNRKSLHDEAVEKIQSRKYDSAISASSDMQAQNIVAYDDIKSLSGLKVPPEHSGRRKNGSDQRYKETFTNVQIKTKEETNTSAKLTITCENTLSPMVIMQKTSVSSTSSLRPKCSLTTVSSSSRTTIKKYLPKRKKKHRYQQKSGLPCKKPVPSRVAQERQVFIKLKRPQLDSRWPALKICSPFNLRSIDTYGYKQLPNMGLGDRRKVRRKCKIPSTGQRSEKEVRSIVYNLKRCSCTLKLKSKTTKTRMNNAYLQKINKLVTKSLQALKLKISALTQHDALLHSNRVSRMREACIPIEREEESRKRYCELPYFLTNGDYSNGRSKSFPDITLRRAFNCGVTEIETKTCMDKELYKAHIIEDSPNDQAGSINSTLNLNIDFSEGDFFNGIRDTITTQFHVNNNFKKFKKKWISQSKKQLNRRSRVAKIKLPHVPTQLLSLVKSKSTFTLTRHNLRLCVLEFPKRECKLHSMISGTFSRGTLTSSRSLPAVEGNSIMTVGDNAIKKWDSHRSMGSLQLYECNSTYSLSHTCNQFKNQKARVGLDKTSDMQKTITQNGFPVYCVDSERPHIITSKKARSVVFMSHSCTCQKISKLSLSSPNMLALVPVNHLSIVDRTKNIDNEKVNKDMILDPNIWNRLDIVKSKLAETQIKQEIKERDSHLTFSKTSRLWSTLKRCGYSLKQLQKENKTTIKSLTTKNRPIKTIVMPAQIFFDNANLPKYQTNKGPHKLSNNFPRVKNNLKKGTLLSSEIMSKILTPNSVMHKVYKNPFNQSYYYAMNLQVQQRGYKLEPYECEPGVCIPGQCNPYECQKRILKRLMRKASTMTATFDRSMAVETDGHPHQSTKKQQFKHYESKPKKLSEYQSRDMQSRKRDNDESGQQRAVRIGSSFSFNVNFSKEGSDKGSRRAPHEMAPKRTKHTPSITHHKASKGTGNLKHGRDSDSQSVNRMHHKGSFTNPKHDRCFCTLIFQKKGKQHTDEDKKNKNKVKTANTGQNTSKKYHHETALSGLLPYECEPNVCVPGHCDPYECLERIKRRNKYTKDFGTEAYSQQSTGTGTNRHMAPDANTMTYYGNTFQSTSTTMIGNQGLNDASTQRFENRKKYNAHRARNTSRPSRQAVRIGSNFSFNIEFYKERPTVTSNFHRRPRYIGHNLSRNSATEVDPYGVHRNVATNGREVGVDNFSSAEIHTKHQKTGVGPRLKRCFCTLALQKEAHEGQKLKQAHSKSKMVSKGTKGKPAKITPTHREAHNKARTYKLLPYECEPGICIPGQCNPHHCAKLIKERLLRESGTVTESHRGRTAHTDTGSAKKLKNRKGQMHTAVSAQQVQVYSPKTHRQMQHGMPADHLVGHDDDTLKQSQQHDEDHDDHIMTHSQQHHEQQGVHANRQVVRIGSNFSFNVEFYKARPPTKKDHDNVSPHRTPNGDFNNISSGTKSYGTDIRNVESRSYGTDGHTMESKAHGTHNRRMENKGSGGPVLKRCFCTLTLQKGGTKTMKQHQKHDIKSEPKSKQKDKHIGTKKDQIYNDAAFYKETGTKAKKLRPTHNLEPYECEPGTCVPGECNPLECYERIKRRELRTLGTGTQKHPRKSIRNMTRESMADEKTQMHHAHVNKQPQAIGETEIRPLYSPINRARDKHPVQSHPKQRQACRVGSSFDFNVEFYKDKTREEGGSRSRNHKRVVKSESRENGNYRSSFPDQIGDASDDRRKGQQRKSRSHDEKEHTQTAKGKAQHTKMKKNAKNTEIQANQHTENKGTVPGKALKRCFCTAELFQAGDNARQNMYTVGRVDRITNIAPFNWLQYPFQCQNDSCSSLGRIRNTDKHRYPKRHKQYLNTTAPVQRPHKSNNKRKKAQIKGFRAKRLVELTIVYLNEDSSKDKTQGVAEKAGLSESAGADHRYRKPRDSQCFKNIRGEIDHSDNVETIQLFVAKKFKKLKYKSLKKSCRHAKYD